MTPTDRLAEIGHRYPADSPVGRAVTRSRPELMRPFVEPSRSQMRTLLRSLPSIGTLGGTWALSRLPLSQLVEHRPHHTEEMRSWGF